MVDIRQQNKMTSLRDELMKRLAEDDDGFFKPGMQIVSGYPFRRKIELVNYCGIPISFNKYLTPDNGCVTEVPKAVSSKHESTVDKETRTHGVAVGTSGTATSTAKVHTSAYDASDKTDRSSSISVATVKSISVANDGNIDIGKKAISAFTNTFIPIETNHILENESLSSYTCMDGESQSLDIHTETTKLVSGSARPIHKVVSDVGEFLQMVERCSPISDASSPGSIAKDNEGCNIEFVNDIDVDVPDLLDWPHGAHIVSNDQEYTRRAIGENNATCVSQTEDTYIATKLSEYVEFVDSSVAPVVATYINKNKSAAETFNADVNENKIENLITFSVPENNAHHGIFSSGERCGTLSNAGQKYQTENGIMDPPLDSSFESFQQTLRFSPVIEIVSSGEENEDSFNLEEQNVNETLVHMDTCQSKQLNTKHSVTTKSRSDNKVLDIKHKMKANGIKLSGPNVMMRPISPSEKVQSVNIRCSNTNNQRNIISQTHNKHYRNVLKTVKPNPMYLTNKQVNYNNPKNKTLFVHDRNDDTCRKIDTKKKYVQKQLEKHVTSECSASKEVIDKQNSCNSKRDTESPGDDVNCSNNSTCDNNQMQIELKKRKRTDKYISFCAKKLQMKNRKTIHTDEHSRKVHSEALVDTSTCQSQHNDYGCANRNTLMPTQKDIGVVNESINVNALDGANRSKHDTKTAHTGLVMKPALSKTRDKPYIPEMNNSTCASSRKGSKNFTQKTERSDLKFDGDVRISKEKAKVNETRMHKENVGKKEITKEEHNENKTSKGIKTGIEKHNSPLKIQTIKKANAFNKKRERTKRVNRGEDISVQKITVKETSQATAKITTCALKNTKSNSSSNNLECLLARVKEHVLHSYNVFVRENQDVLDEQNEERNTQKIDSNVVDNQMFTKTLDVTEKTKRSPNNVHESLQIEDSKLSYLPKFSPSYICDICNDLYFTTAERLDFHYRVSHSASHSPHVSEHVAIVNSVTSTPLEQDNTAEYNWTELGDSDSVRNMLSTLIGESDKQKRNLCDSKKDEVDKEDVRKHRNRDDLRTGQKCPPDSEMQSKCKHQNSTNTLQWEKQVEHITPEKTINKSMVETSELRYDTTLNSSREESINRYQNANNSAINNGETSVANLSGKSISMKSTIVSEIQKTNIDDAKSSEKFEKGNELHYEKQIINKELLQNEPATICDETSVKLKTEKETIRQTKELTNSDGKKTRDQLDTVVFETHDVDDAKLHELHEKPVLHVAKHLLLLSSVDSDSDKDSIRVRADSLSSVDSLASALEYVTVNANRDTPKRHKPYKEHGIYPYDDTRSGYRERFPQRSEETREIIRRPIDSFEDRIERSECHIRDSVSSKNSRDHVENIKGRHDSNSSKSSDITRERDRLRYESGSSMGSHRSYDGVAWDKQYVKQDNITRNKHHTSPNRFEHRNHDRRLTPKRTRSISRDRSREMDLREKITRVKDTRYGAGRESRYRGRSPRSPDSHRRNTYNEKDTSERRIGAHRRRSRSNDSHNKSRDSSSKNTDRRHGHSDGNFKEDSANRYRHIVRKTFSYSKHDRSFTSRYGWNYRSSSRRPDNLISARNRVERTESDVRSSKCEPFTSKTVPDAQDNGKSISKASVNKQSSNVPVKEHSSKFTVNEQTSPVNVNEKTSQDPLKEQTSPVTVYEHTGQVTVNEQTRQVTVKEQPSQVTAKEQSNKIPVNEQTNRVSLKEQTSQVTMNEQSSNVTGTEQTSLVTGSEEISQVSPKEQASQVSVNEQTSQVSVNEQTSQVSGSEQTSQVSPKEQTSQVTGTEQTSQVTDSEQTSHVSPKEQTSQVTGTEQTSQVTASEQTSNVSPKEETSPVTVNEQTSQVTGSEQTRHVSPKEQLSQVTGTEQTSQVTASKQTSRVSPKDQTSQVTVYENENKNDTYEVKMKSHKTMDTDNKKNTSMELYVETSGTLQVLCQKCGSEFDSVDELHKHMYEEHLAVFKCNECKFGFATPTDHGRHMSKQHNRKKRERRMSGDRDKQKTRHKRERKMSGDSDKHKTKHKEHAQTQDMDSGDKHTSRAKKRDADKGEVKKDAMDKKYEREEGELVDYNTFCRFCQVDFQTRDKLSNHLWKKHGKRIFSTWDRKIVPPPFEKYRNTPGYDQRLTCQVCHLRCKTKDHLFKHLELTSHYVPKTSPQRHLTLKGLQHL